jgi:hypothetical protein
MSNNLKNTTIMHTYAGKNFIIVSPSPVPAALLKKAKIKLRRTFFSFVEK